MYLPARALPRPYGAARADLHDVGANEFKWGVDPNISCRVVCASGVLLLCILIDPMLNQIWKCDRIDLGRWPYQQVCRSAQGVLAPQTFQDYSV